MKKTFSQVRENLSVPIGQTYDRDLMPQITDPKAFIEHLRSQSIPFDRKKIDSNTLKSTQLNFDMNKIQGILASRNFGDNDPIFTSNDNQILDGHHRWIANYYSGRPTDCHVVDLPILELMRVAKEHLNDRMSLNSDKINEEITHKDFGPMLDSFVSFASDKLGIKSLPNIRYKDSNEDFSSFGGYNPSEKSIVIATKNRHPMDIYRTLAHELVHCKQDEDGRIKDVTQEGSTGSSIENEANAVAGQIMRWYAKANPDSFKLAGLVESKAIFVVGVPCSGKDTVIRNIQESLMELNYYQEVDIQTIEKKKQLAENIIVSASANNYDSIVRAKSHLENIGYMTEMVFVDVPNRISKLRNEQRATKGQRVINESIRFKKYEESKSNLNLYEKLFDTIHLVINEENLHQWFKSKSDAAKPTAASAKVATYKEMNENDEGVLEKDACYHKVKARYKVWPSAYASGALVKCRKKGAANWGKNSVKEATNVNREENQITDVDKQFTKFLENNTSELNTYKREEGSKDLADLYKKGTPGQWTDENCGCEKTKNEEDDKMSRSNLNEKRKIVRKNKIEEDGILDSASGAIGLPVSDSIGPEVGVGKSEIGLARSIYPYGTYGISESVSSWANKPETIQRFNKKYGRLAEQKLLETVKVINDSISNKESRDMPKSVTQLRESPGYDSSMIGRSNTTKDEMYETTEGERPGLWANIRKRRASGKPMRRKGEKGAPTETQLRSAKGLDETTEGVSDSPAWQRKEGKDPEGGLNKKGIASYRRDNPGSKLSMAVTTDPSKLKKGSKKWKRRKSFCARMSGVEGPMKDEKGKPTRKALALRKWNCE